MTTLRLLNTDVLRGRFIRSYPYGLQHTTVSPSYAVNISRPHLLLYLQHTLKLTETGLVWMTRFRSKLLNLAGTVNRFVPFFLSRENILSTPNCRNLLNCQCAWKIYRLSIIFEEFYLPMVDFSTVCSLYTNHGAMSTFLILFFEKPFLFSFCFHFRLVIPEPYRLFTFLCSGHTTGILDETVPITTLKPTVIRSLAIWFFRLFFILVHLGQLIFFLPKPCTNPGS